MNKNTLIAGAAVLAALGTGGALANAANADTTSPTPISSTASASPTTTSTSSTSSTESSTKEERGGRHRGPGGGLGGVSVDDLAAKLGVDSGRLSTALDKVKEATEPSSTDREAQRDLTEAQRQAARTAQRTATAKALAGELGIDQAQVTTALDELDGERNAERAADYQPRLAQAVTDGTLTQSEADAVNKAIENGVVGGR